MFGDVRVYGNAVDLWTVWGDLEDDKVGGQTTVYSMSSSQPSAVTLW